FRPPLDDVTSWEGFHGQWPAMIVQKLNSQLPPHYVAEPRVHLGSAFEIDVATYDNAADHGDRQDSLAEDGGTTASWTSVQPTVLLETALPVPPEYEVLVYDLRRGRRLVAAVEIISPANKDRPNNRRAFVQKCESLLRQGVCVTIVDVVTIRSANLYRELAEQIGAASPLASPLLYAVTCRSRHRDDIWRVEAWAHELTVGSPLPTLPLWLTENQAVPLDLEASYEETCRVLRLPSR
ncbi:MAG TPA: DUF4058 family protein, partial [Planctomycetaceae bacterium]|nr:DUF4058 family protein [Planctomycetaceae bacterium]